MGAVEMHQRLEHLKRSIHRVHLYSQSEAQPLSAPEYPSKSDPGPIVPEVFILKVNITQN